MKGFIKITETGETLFAPNFVENKDYKLNAKDKDTYTFPIDGWNWTENYEEKKNDTETNPIN